MKEPLEPGWQEDRYTCLDTVTRIIAYWNFGGTHPGSRERPSPAAMRKAREALKSIIHTETHEAKPPPARRDPFYLADGGSSSGFGKPGWHLGPEPTQAPRPATVSWVDLPDLVNLCPGVFSDPSQINAKSQPPRTRTGTSREDALNKALKGARENLMMRATNRREPSTKEVIRELERRPETGAIAEYQNDAIVWEDAQGKLHTTKHKTIAERLTRIRKSSS